MPVRVRSPALRPARCSDFCQKGAKSTTPTGGSAAVAVRANNLALLDLLEDGLPRPVGECGSDLEPLVLSIHVVELEHDRIGFSAVGAGMGREKLDKELRPFVPQLPLRSRACSTYRCLFAR